MLTALLLAVSLAGCSNPKYKDMEELGYHYDDSKRCFVKGPPYTGWDFAMDSAEFVAGLLGGG
jgi:hypothetical protein